MFESTTYAGHFFGSMKSDVESILSQGKHVLTVMDICGAMAMKTHFPHVITVYTKREKKSLMSAIIEREIPTAEKVNRLLAIEAEKQNAGICDYVIDSNDVDTAAAKILSDLDVR
jgi:guanylate kinase